MELADQVLKDDKHLIEEANVQLRPEKSDGTRDEKVDMHLIHKLYFFPMTHGWFCNKLPK